ncbi:575cd2aa-6a3d-4721-9698-c48cb01147e2 [Sclerotinia trifoliorum]|uniref:575cd2aa-6a3d-4721-9698-c48cb01147e2 n=1 Tax=Sclerotinia trifoliorum TaxID=28548 RepID=A0A8H2ZRI5_9HELO|nr:575cd2aa-6a3d-4721-9698-c48cb01147e2 [Sclerotinia trifoliorum]
MTDRDTIMNDRDGTQRFKSVLDVEKPSYTLVSFKEVLDISSDDESADSDDLNSFQPAPSCINNMKLSQQAVAPNYTSLVEGILNEHRREHDQTRVQRGRIRKPKGRKSVNNNESIAQRVVGRRPLMSVEENGQMRPPASASNPPDRAARSVHQPHVSIPQSREVRSGPGQIPQYGLRRMREDPYTYKSLHAKVVRHRSDTTYLRRPDLPCLPFVLQITILRSLQSALESMCYRFVQKWLPRILVANEWDCPENIELNLWWKAIDECHIPIEAIGPQPSRPLNAIFRRVQNIRHLAVHRLPDISIANIQDMIIDALDIAKVFRDDSLVPKLKLWREKLKYFSELIRDSQGSLDVARKIDSIHTLKEDNIRIQEKLRKDVEALKNEILVKEQQISTLQGEYNTHLKKENDIIKRARTGDRPIIQEAEPLGNFKWLEKCFTLALDRDAPNLKPAENLSGEVIRIQNIGATPFVQAVPNNAGVANMNVESRINLGPVAGGSNLAINPNLSHGPDINGTPHVGLLRAGSTPAMIPIPGANDVLYTHVPSKLVGIPGLGRRTVTGPTLSSRGRQPIPATAVIIDLTDEDYDVMAE